MASEYQDPFQPTSVDAGRGGRSFIVPFAVIGITLAWAMLHYVKRAAREAPVGSAAETAVLPAVQPAEEAPYVERPEGAARLGVLTGRNAPRRVAKEIKPDGTIIYGEPDPEAVAAAIAEAEKQRQREVLRNRPRASREERKAHLAAQAGKRPEVHLNRATKEYVDQMRASGELDVLLDAQHKRMMEQLRKGYGPEGGPSREEIDRLRRDGELLYR